MSKILEMLTTIDSPTGVVIKAISVGDRTELQERAVPLPWSEFCSYIAAGEAHWPMCPTYQAAAARAELTIALERMVSQ